MDLQIKLIATQIVAFLIVLWVLRKYAWGKLLGLMPAGRDDVAAERLWEVSEQLVDGALR